MFRVKTQFWMPLQKEQSSSEKQSLAPGEGLGSHRDRDKVASSV